MKFCKLKIDDTGLSYIFRNNVKGIPKRIRLRASKPGFETYAIRNVKCLLVLRTKSNKSWKYFKLCDNKIYCAADCDDLKFGNLPKSQEYIYSIKALNMMGKYHDFTFQGNFRYV